MSVPAPTCPCCCDAYTAKVRVAVRCVACDYAPCVRCAKTFLLASLTDPCCMNCRNHWSRAFIDDNFTASWRSNELKKHREQVLFDRERSLLPATQPLVERAAERMLLEEKKRQAFNAKLEAHRAYLRASQLWSDAINDLHNFDRGRSQPQGEQQRREFVAACPTEDCRGFLSSQYRCGTCLNTFCAHCRVLKSETHVCDPELVSTLRAIAKDSRACPGCGTAISRVSGCDQMWCINCDVAFSYASGERIQGVIHNPHYFERLRQLRQTAAADPDAIAALHPGEIIEHHCGQWPAIRAFNWLPGETFDRLTCFYQTGLNLEQTILPRLLRRRREDNVDLRIRYCLKTLDEARFKSLVEQRERERDFNVDVGAALQLFVLLTLELLYQVAACRPKPDATILAQEMLAQHILRVTELVQNALQDLARRYKKKTYAIIFPDETWRGFRDLCLDPNGSRGTLPRRLRR